MRRRATRHLADRQQQLEHRPPEQDASATHTTEVTTAYRNAIARLLVINGAAPVDR
jgi:hypothetical protein